VDAKYLKTKMDKTIVEAYTLRFIVIVLAVVIIAEAVFIGIVVENRRTVVLPPRVSKQFWVAGNRVSEGYLTQMGDYLSQTILNFTPKDYKIQLGNFMLYVLPARYKSIRTALNNQMQAVTQLGVSSVFYPTNTKIKDSQIIITGVNHTFKKSIAKDKQKKVIITFAILNGRFYITKIQVKGSV
jgi:conjugal transfer pilus assembly protein TraE